MSTEEQTKHASAQDEVEDRKAGEVRHKAPLSVPQLVLRRGLAVLAAVLLLAASIVVYLTCPLPLVQFKSNVTTDWGNQTSPTAFPNSTTTNYPTVRPI